MLTIITSSLLLAAGAFAVWIVRQERRGSEEQAALEPFYTPPTPLPSGPPGEVLRQEPLGIDVPGGQGWRILYRSEFEDGTPTVSSGMIFIPAGPPPATPRPVVAWAHGTVGMAPRCAPSRSENPLSQTTWLSLMLARGWVVAATDYSGLGTPGVERYLLGRDEARDVLNSVRAAMSFEGSDAGSDFAVWGHSQGGHAALFAAQEAKSYAPELNLIASAAAAPAAELNALISEQYKTAVGWVIGPEVLVAWPQAYPELSPADVTTSQGLKSHENLARECVVTAAAIAKLRQTLRQNFFSVNPVELPAWYRAAARETPGTPPSPQPLLIAQGLEDEVVPPDTTSLLVQQSCQAGADLTTLWLGGTGHVTAAQVAGPFVVDWLSDRFDHKPTNPTCDQMLPIAPAEMPKPPEE